MARQSILLILVALAGVTFMSLVPVLIKSTQASPVTIGIARLSIAFSLITPFFLWRERLFSLSARTWMYLSLIGLVFGLHWWAFFFGIKTSGAATSAIAQSMFGIFLLLLNGWLKHQRVSLLQWLAIATCVFGCILVSPTPSLNDKVFLGFIVGLFSAFLYALLPLLHQQVAEQSTLVRTWGQFTFAGLFFLFLWPQSDWDLESKDWKILVTLGTVCTLLAHALWVKASTELPGIFTSAIYYLYVPFTMIQSLMFLDESITWMMTLGATMIIMANLVILLMPVLKERFKKKNIFVNRTLSEPPNKHD